jgi:DNA-nicking Smr family endonuclease
MNGEKPAPEPISRVSRRRLTTDEEHLWSLVVRSVRPLRPAKRQMGGARHKAAVRDAARTAKKRAAVAPEVAVSHQRILSPPALAPIMRRERQQLARGRAPIDARIDLHGMTQAEAHSSLRRFLLTSQTKGAKFVLVITGKGAPDAPRGERGVLRQQVPLWLALPEFRRHVLGFDIAHTGHGGDGALYVRLRKAKERCSPET